MFLVYLLTGARLVSWFNWVNPWWLKWWPKNEYMTVYFDIAGQQRRSGSSGVGNVIKFSFSGQPALHPAVPTVCDDTVASNSLWQHAPDVAHCHDSILTGSRSAVQHLGGCSYPGGVCCGLAWIHHCALSIGATDAGAPPAASLQHSRPERETYTDAAEHEVGRTRAINYRDIWPVGTFLMLPQSTCWFTIMPSEFFVHLLQCCM